MTSIDREEVGYAERRAVFPFTAFVGQEDLKRGLIVNAIDPSIGGILIEGDKGTGKSTIARGLADLLPPIEVISDCPFNCNPHDVSEQCDDCQRRIASGEKVPIEKVKMTLIDLPIAATEDMLVGTFDVEKAIQEGEIHLEPGILAKANRNILYVDEINLLPDHLVDDILDIAGGGGINVIEREGISTEHPCRFILIGTMNPEEGQIRPQLLDRLPLHIRIKGEPDPDKRVEIMKRNLAFEKDPIAFRKLFQPEQEKLAAAIARARTLLPEIELPDNVMKAIAYISIDLKLDGHRPDIVMARSAKANAAFRGNKIVEDEDLFTAARLSLTHRTRESGFTAPPSVEEINAIVRSALKSAKK